MDLKDATLCVPRTVATRVVFSIASELFTWADVLRAAETRGSWQEHLVSVSDAVVADTHALSADNVPTADEVDAAATKFRRDRNLIAGDDLLKWLAHWDVSMPDWEESLHRRLSRERFSGELDGLRESGPAYDAAIAAAMWPDAVCSGFIEQAGGQLCADAALALGSGCAAGGRARSDFERIQAAADVARSDALRSEVLEREVADHRLEWTAVRGWWLALPDEDMAKEAAMCVRNDGSSLANVARECGEAAEGFSMLLADIDNVLLSHTLAAREGDLIGPLRLGERWVLATIEQKLPPSLNDPLVRQRAQARGIRRAEERAISRYVTWHESL
jgi:hypothetical protein